MKKILSLVLALCMVLCMASFASAEDVPTVKVITLGNGQPDNYEAWIEKLNPYVEEKIGAKLDVECIGWGDWGSRRSVIINTNEPYDVIFGDSGNLRQDVAVGAYLDITDLLAENAPGLLELIPAGYWDACRVNGRIYGVPTYKDSSITQYFVWDVEVLKELGLEEDAKNCHTLEEATPLLQKIKDAKGVASFPLTKDGVSQIPFIFDSFGAGLRGIGVRYNDKEAKVVKIFEEEDVMAQLKTVRGWYESGIINADAPNLAEGPTYKACFLAQGWSLAAKTVWGPNMGKELVAYTYGPTILSNDSVLGSVNFVSVNSEHPDKALAYLNLINTDSKVRDAFYYGLEGENFTYTENGRVHKNADKGWGLAGYTQGTFFNVTPTDDVEFNQWDEVHELNDAAEPSVLLGFAFDSSKVEDQIQNCATIWDRYHPELLTGSVDPEATVKTMYEEMEAEGLNDIIAEAQAQIDAFLGK
ncbi:MAG: ABC transporter substrate-binding protein [Eubacteriales bacterium]|nr:ABC transporter substrate-binding protein [Eubacteriales bacterium]